MVKKRNIAELADGIVKEMERMNYASETIRIFRLDCRKFSDYVRETDIACRFSEEVGISYLRDKYNFPTPEGEHLSKEGVRGVRCVRRLGEYALYGGFSHLAPSASPPISQWVQSDAFIVNAFIGDTLHSDNVKSTKENRISAIRKFYEFLGCHGIAGVNYLSANVISDYIKSASGYAKSTQRRLLTVLRSYLRYAAENKYCDKDWSFSVPTVKKAESLRVPALWTKEELAAVLGCIDRGSPVGKRDYAVILTALQLGLRRSDISNLRLDNLKWERGEHGEIELVQQKTGKPLLHSMPNDLGWALIDYIRFARPKVDEPYVFIKLNAPFVKLAPHSVGDILERYVLMAGIAKRPRVVSGMHSLRHALARRLLSQGTSLQDVADIMGHTSYNSTKPYLRVDIDGLRECCLSTSEVLNYAK